VEQDEVRHELVLLDDGLGVAAPNSTAVLAIVCFVIVSASASSASGRIQQAKRPVLAGTARFICLGPFVYFGFEAFDTTGRPGG
jgi:hypothetical protein